MNKAASAEQTLAALNSEIRITVSEDAVSTENIESLFEAVDLVCCAVDDLEATRLLGSHASLSGIPMVWGGGYRLGGFITVIQPPDTPCVKCCLAAWEEERAKYLADPSRPGRHLLPTVERLNPCVGAAAGAVGSIQAMEAIKLLVGFGPNMKGSMLAFQLGGPEMGFRTFDLSPLKRPDCPTCGIHAET